MDDKYINDNIKVKFPFNLTMIYHNLIIAFSLILNMHGKICMYKGDTIILHSYENEE